MKWSPDHCSCEINLAFDDTSSNPQPEYLTPDGWRELYIRINNSQPPLELVDSTREKVCRVHEPFKGTPLLYQIVLRENQKKNKTVQAVRQALFPPSATQDEETQILHNILRLIIQAKDIQPGLNLLQLIVLDWEGQPSNRTMTVTGASLTSTNKQAIQTLCDKILGPGQALIS